MPVCTLQKTIKAEREPLRYNRYVLRLETSALYGTPVNAKPYGATASYTGRLKLSCYALTLLVLVICFDAICYKRKCFQMT